VIDRSETREDPNDPLTLQVAEVLGTRIAETILARGHVAAATEAGHMIASDPIKVISSGLVGRGPSTYESWRDGSLHASSSLRLCG
jgi:hypothetical protein